MFHKMIVLLKYINHYLVNQRSQPDCNSLLFYADMPKAYRYVPFICGIIGLGLAAVMYRIIPIHFRYTSWRDRPLFIMLNCNVYLYLLLSSAQRGLRVWYVIKLMEYIGTLIYII